MKKKDGSNEVIEALQYVYSLKYIFNKIEEYIK
jgi:hypothetical protein